MSRSSIVFTAAVALALASLAQGVLAQPAPGAQPADPSTQAQPAQQSGLAEEPATMPLSSSEPSPATPAPEESSAAAPTTGPDARAATSAGMAADPGAEPNPRLAALTPPGMSPEEACTGFKSLTECATALHAAQNLNIPFADLKSRLSSGRKLGAAIHDLKPEANAREEARRAEEQARSDGRAPHG